MQQVSLTGTLYVIYLCSLFGKLKKITHHPLSKQVLLKLLCFYHFCFTFIQTYNLSRAFKHVQNCISLNMTFSSNCTYFLHCYLQTKSLGPGKKIKKVWRAKLFLNINTKIYKVYRTVFYLILLLSKM